MLGEVLRIFKVVSSIAIYLLLVNRLTVILKADVSLVNVGVRIDELVVNDVDVIEVAD